MARLAPFAPNMRTRMITCIASFLSFLLLLPAQAEPPRAMTPADIARLRHVAAAELSPNGAHVAYLLSVPRRPMQDKDGPAWSELHVVDLKGNSRPYVTGDVNVENMDWTPDGKGISFVAKRGSDKHAALYVIPLDGGEARAVVRHKAAVGSYSWSPDGRQVAFLSTADEPKRLKSLKDKGFAAEVYEEQWRPARVWIAAVGGSSARPHELDLPGSATAVEWSPVGERLLVTLSPTSLVDDTYMNKRVHVVDVASGKVLASFNTTGKLGRAAWSPDGKHVAMITAADRNDPAEGRLLVGSADGGDLRDVLPNVEGHVTSLAWQSAETILYTLDLGVSTEFGKVKFDGSERKAIVPAGKHVLGGIRLARDGLSGTFLCQSPQHPPEVYYMKHGDEGPRRLTTSNRWLSDVRLAKQEVVTYKARDGLQIEGILLHPLDEKPGTRYPLILMVHGGPESHFSNGWLTRYAEPGQVFAGRGYAVFYPNYRGSTGRGVAFSKADQGDEGGKEFDDLVDGIDHLVELGLVDKSKVGVTGGSYGGFASAWCATYYTQRFAAAAMFVGISDQISKAGTTDIPEEMYLVHTRKRPWEDWQDFLKRSPVYYSPQARTPILILGGKDDPRVHPSQSLELYRYLKTLGRAPVRLVQYPGEGHGNRKAAARFDYSLRLLQWMDHYLKGPGGAPPPADLPDQDLKAASQPASRSSDGVERADPDEGGE